jgi:Raf kinase inhibitor-like YbhB/YbcL family protein
MKIRIFLIILIIGIFFLPVLAYDKLEVESPAFKEGGMIPVKYTCKGMNMSPAISWKGEPIGTKSFVIICNDPDAPVGNWIHWIVYNIPPGTNYIAGGFAKKAKRKDGIRQAKTSFGTVGYGGPCPPSGTHRYFFSIYALNIKLDLDPEKTTYMDIVKVMQAHTLGFGQTMGKFKQ